MKPPPRKTRLDRLLDTVSAVVPGKTVYAINKDYRAVLVAARTGKRLRCGVVIHRTLIAAVIPGEVGNLRGWKTS